MTTYWVLVANNAFAQVYQLKGKQLELLERVENPDGHKKTGDFLSDRPGRSFSSVGPGRSSLESQVDPKVHALEAFALKLAHSLKKAKEENKFDSLILIAPAAFLGYLNGSLSESVRKQVIKEIGKDLPESMTEQDRVKHINQYLEFLHY